MKPLSDEFRRHLLARIELEDARISGDADRLEAACEAWEKVWETREKEEEHDLVLTALDDIRTLDPDWKVRTERENGLSRLSELAAADVLQVIAMVEHFAETKDECAILNRARALVYRKLGLESLHDRFFVAAYKA